MRAEMLHQVEKPTPWWKGATLFKTREEDAVDSPRVGTKFQEWSKHWQVGEEVQDQDKLWENLQGKHRNWLPPTGAVGRN